MTASREQIKPREVRNVESPIVGWLQKSGNTPKREEKRVKEGVFYRP